MSYNELFGLGSHTADISLVGWWKLQETAGTVASDASGKGHDGTIVGMGSDPVVTLGPSSWLPSAIDLSGLEAYVDLGLTGLGSDRATISLFCKVDQDPPSTTGNTGFGVFGENPTSGPASHLPWIDGRIYSSTLRGESVSSLDRITVGNPVASLTDWRHLEVKTTPGPGGWQFLIDGVVVSTASGLSNLYTDGTWWLGGRLAGGGLNYWLQGQVAGLSVFSRDLSPEESEEKRLGPEPLSHGQKPVLHGDGTVTSVTNWDSQDNGDITRTTTLHLASDDSIVATIEGIHPDFSEHILPNLSYYVVERGSNDGGFDIVEDAVSLVQGILPREVLVVNEVISMKKRPRVISVR